MAGPFSPNQVTYNVGSKTSVSTVATSRPPMIATAIGPQNTVGAIGIMPRTVDTAVSSLVGQTMEDVERKLILQTLQHCGGDPTHTAFMLGMPLVTLCNKLAVYFSDSAGELPQPAADMGYGAKGSRL